MAAGLGFKTFTTGEVLSAANVNGYLMQGVLVFASAAARDAAITSPQEGQFAYLKDTNVTTYYTGSAWANLDTTGMTNPMTTTGDTIYSSSGSTPARLAIGSTGNVLTVAGGVPTWAAPAATGANFSLVNAGGTALTGATTITVSGITDANTIMVVIDSAGAGNSSQIQVLLNGASANYQTNGLNVQAPSAYSPSIVNGSSYTDRIVISDLAASAGQAQGFVLIDGCNTAGVKVFNSAGGSNRNASNSHQGFVLGGIYNSSSVISSISVVSTVGNFNNGTVFVYKA
jgi:hypothetical protein